MSLHESLERSTSRRTSWVVGLGRGSKKQKYPKVVTSEEGVFVERVGIDPDAFPELPFFQQAGRGITNKGVLINELPNTARLFGESLTYLGYIASNHNNK
jgi:hypothetical protein